MVQGQPTGMLLSLAVAVWEVQQQCMRLQRMAMGLCMAASSMVQMQQPARALTV
jgi:hypothetical protein